MLQLSNLTITSMSETPFLSNDDEAYIAQPISMVDSEHKRKLISFNDKFGLFRMKIGAWVELIKSQFPDKSAYTHQLLDTSLLDSRIFIDEDNYNLFAETLLIIQLTQRGNDPFKYLELLIADFFNYKFYRTSREEILIESPEYLINRKELMAYLFFSLFQNHSDENVLNLISKLPLGTIFSHPGEKTEIMLADFLTEELNIWFTDIDKINAELLKLFTHLDDHPYNLNFNNFIINPQDFEYLKNTFIDIDNPQLLFNRIHETLKDIEKLLQDYRSRQSLNYLYQRSASPNEGEIPISSELTAKSNGEYVKSLEDLLILNNKSLNKATELIFEAYFASTTESESGESDQNFNNIFKDYIKFAMEMVDFEALEEIAKLERNHPAVLVCMNFISRSFINNIDASLVAKYLSGFLDPENEKTVDVKLATLNLNSSKDFLYPNTELISMALSHTKDSYSSKFKNEAVIKKIDSQIDVEFPLAVRDFDSTELTTYLALDPEVVVQEILKPALRNLFKNIKNSQEFGDERVNLNIYLKNYILKVLRKKSLVDLN